MAGRRRVGLVIGVVTVLATLTAASLSPTGHLPPAVSFHVTDKHNGLWLVETEDTTVGPKTTTGASLASCSDVAAGCGGGDGCSVACGVGLACVQDSDCEWGLTCDTGRAVCVDGAHRHSTSTAGSSLSVDAAVLIENVDSHSALRSGLLRWLPVGATLALEGVQSASVKQVLDSSRPVTAVGVVVSLHLDPETSVGIPASTLQRALQAQLDPLQVSVLRVSAWRPLPPSLFRSPRRLQLPECCACPAPTNATVRQQIPITQGEPADKLSAGVTLGVSAALLLSIGAGVYAYKRMYRRHRAAARARSIAQSRRMDDDDDWSEYAAVPSNEMSSRVRGLSQPSSRMMDNPMRTKRMSSTREGKSTPQSPPKHPSRPSREVELQPLTSRSPTKKKAPATPQSSSASDSSTNEPVWQAVLDDDGVTPYYFNRLTGQSEWTKPADFDGEDPKTE